MTGAYALITTDRQAWDAFAQRHVRHGHPLQSSGWGALKSAFGWSAQYLAVVGPQGICTGAMLLSRRRLGLSAIYTPRGPLFSGDPGLIRSFSMAWCGSAQYLRAVFLRDRAQPAGRSTAGRSAA